MKRLITICLAMVLLGSSYAMAGTWTTIDMPGAYNTYPQGISGNNVVGWSYDEYDNKHGFLYNRTTSNWTPLDKPGVSETYPQGISGSDIVGSYYDGDLHGFRYNWMTSTWSGLDMPGADETHPQGTDGSNIVGYYIDNYGEHCFLYDGKTWTILNMPGAPDDIEIYPMGISGNNIVGYFNDGTGTHGFLHDVTSSQWIVANNPYPVNGESYYCKILGIDGDNIVGIQLIDETTHGFLHYNGGTLILFDYPGGTDYITYPPISETFLNGISGNDIVGEYRNFGEDIYHGFIYTIPEPATISLLALGSLAIMRKRKCKTFLKKGYFEKEKKIKTKHQQLKTALFAVIVLALGAASQAWGASYKAIDLHPSGCDWSCASGISGTHQVGYGWQVTNVGHHALLWNGSADSYIDLNPSGFDWSYAWGISGTQQVGYGWGSATGGAAHALLWNGSAASCVDLNPEGFVYSSAFGISGIQQVGWGMGSATGYYYHAQLWSGSAISYVDLNPSGFDYSYAQGTNGTQQVGAGSGAATGGNDHALLWNGSPDSYVDLNPSGFDWSCAYGISGTQQVGVGGGSAGPHALLWNGSPISCVDLNPDGFDGSKAWATNGTQQVGDGIIGGQYHALLWNGTAESCIDLHQFLPAGFYTSRANGIDSYGNIVGSAYDSSGYEHEHAILWQLIPEADPIQEILDFIEKSVSDGTLIPVRPVPSGKGQLGALVNMINAAGELLKNEDIKGACGQLHAALGKTDGKGQPPDFVKGEASVELAQMIQELMTSLGCQ
jgi:hypothetical protein